MREKEKIGQWIEQATQAVAAGDLISALRLLHRAHRVTPADRDLLLAIAHVYVRMENHALAEDALERILKRAPEDGECWKLLGQVEKEQGRPYRALEAYQKAWDLGYHAGDAAAELATTYASVGNGAAAERFAHFALRNKPKQWEPHRLLADQFLERGRVSDAADEYQKAIDLGGPFEDLNPLHERAREEVEESRSMLEQMQAQVAEKPADKELPMQLCIQQVRCGDMEGALDTVTKAAGRHPNDARLAELRSRVLFELERYEESIEEFQRASHWEPKEYWLDELLQRVERRAGTVEERSAEYKRRLAKGQPEVWRFLNLALALYREPKFEETKAVLEQALIRWKDNGDLHKLLGDTLDAMGKGEESLAAYQRALSLDNENADFLNSLGNAYFRLGKHEEARQAYRKALTLNPSFDWPHHNLSLIHLERGDNEPAVREARMALEANPHYVSARNTLAVALLRLRRFDECERECLRILEEEDDDAAYVNLANVYDEKGEDTKAEESYKKAIELNPDHPANYQEYGIFLSRRGRHREAQKAFSRALRLEPKSASVRSYMGIDLLDQGKVTSALKLLEKAVKLDPMLSVAWHNLGLAHLRAKQHEHALAAYKRAAELDASFAPTLNDMGCVFEELERWDEAALAYRKALSIDANDGIALQNLANLYFRKPTGTLVTKQEALDCLQRSLVTVRDVRRLKWALRRLDRLKAEDAPRDTGS
ncbi:MAG: tetratricopeptide repeat protein [Planctomycetota bacterium]